MQETYVCLHYTCGHCHGPVNAKLHCSGAGLSAGPHAAAGVKLTCPHCHKVSQVFFELTGMVLDVTRCEPRRTREPSLN